MKTKHIRLFSIESNLFSFPSYALCAVHHVNDEDVCGESFLLTMFNSQKAKLTAVEVNLSSEAFNLINHKAKFDENFVIEECLNQAKLNMLEISKNKALRYDFSRLAFIQNVTEIEVEYLFHNLFMQEKIREKIEKIGSITKIKELKEFVETLVTSKLFVIHRLSE